MLVVWQMRQERWWRYVNILYIIIVQYLKQAKYSTQNSHKHVPTLIWQSINLVTNLFVSLHYMKRWWLDLIKLHTTTVSAHSHLVLGAYIFILWYGWWADFSIFFDIVLVYALFTTLYGTWITILHTRGPNALHKVVCEDTPIRKTIEGQTSFKPVTY